MNRCLLLTLIFLGGSVEAQTSIEELTHLDPIEILGDEPDTALLPDLVLEKTTARHFDQIQQLVPNLSSAGGSNRARYFQIRGLGERDQYKGAPNHSVGVFLDGVDLTGVGGALSGFATRWVDVQPGPQSIEFGGQAIAGTVSAKTDFSKETRLSMGTGDQNRVYTAAKVSDGDEGVVIEHLSEDGPIKNQYLGSDQTAKRSETLLRAHSNLLLTENTQVDLNAIFINNNNGYDHWSHKNDLTTLSDRPGRDDQQTFGLALHWETALSRNWSFRSLTSLSSSRILYSYDEDWGNDERWKTTPGWNKRYNYDTENRQKREVWHQRVSLIRGNWKFGFHGSGLAESAQAWAYQDGDLRDATSKSSFRKTGLAFLTTYKIVFSPQWQLEIGQRWENEKQHYNDTNNLNLAPKNHYLASLGKLRYRVNENTDLRLQLTSGYKSAGFNLDRSLSEHQRHFRAEKALSAELGLSHTTLSNDLRLNFFQVRVSDQQIDNSLQTDPTNPSEFTVFTGNAAASSSQGLELSSNHRHSPNFSTSLSVGYLEARFLDYTFKGRDYQGRALAHAPNYNFALGAHYTVREKHTFSLETTGRGEHYFSNSHDQKAKAVELLHFKYRFSRENDSIDIGVRNVFNRSYAIRGFYFGNEPPNFTQKLYTQRGEPRRWQINYSRSF